MVSNDGCSWDALFGSDRPGGLGKTDLYRFQLVNGKYETVDTVPTARGARTITVDEKLHRAYLPAADLMPAVGNERPKPVPGTFRILVVAPSS